jgi:hypothetical protein
MLDGMAVIEKESTTPPALPAVLEKKPEWLMYGTVPEPVVVLRKKPVWPKWAILGGIGLPLLILASWINTLPNNGGWQILCAAVATVWWSTGMVMLLRKTPDIAHYEVTAEIEPVHLPDDLR